MFAALAKAIVAPAKALKQPEAGLDLTNTANQFAKTINLLHTMPG